MKKGIIAVLLSVLLFITVLPQGRGEAAAPDPSFSDIKGHWAESIINIVASKGYVTGFPDGTFRPDDVITGEQFLVMLFRAYSESVVHDNGSIGFDWEKNYKQFLSDNHPADMSQLYLAMQKTNFDFKPATTGNWAKPYIDMVYAMGLLGHYDDVFQMNTNDFSKQLKRQDISYLTSKWILKYEEGFDFQYMDLAKVQAINDSTSFSITNAVGLNVGAVLLTGVMRGYPNKNFYPQRYVTRAESSVIIATLRNLIPRNPFKPNLTGYYTSISNGFLHIFNNKEEYDHYNKIIELSSEIEGGYVDVEPLGIAIFENQADYRKANFDQLYYGSIQAGTPTGEAGYGIDTTDKYHAETMSFDYYDSLSNISHSKKIRNDWIAYWVGADRVSSFLDKVSSETAGSLDSPDNFVFDGKKFEFVRINNSYRVNYLYKE